MAIFFLVVGLEVKRELAVGELSTRQAALLPLFAAVGGMVVPAAIFLGVMGGEPGSRGWGIPMATDVAFALAALAALGRRVPTALIAFLLRDLGVIALCRLGARPQQGDFAAVVALAVRAGHADSPIWLGGNTTLMSGRLFGRSLK